MVLRVSFEGLSGSRVFLACFGLAITFVSSLYAVSAGLPRNHPVTVRRRISVIACVCLLSPAYVWAWSTREEGGEPLWRVLGLKPEGFLWALTSPLLLVGLAYLGPLIHYASIKANPFIILREERWDISLRNYVVAPFSEEFVFRACLIPILLPAIGTLSTVLLCPLFFGLAHVHHIIEWVNNRDGPLTDVILGLAFQVGYTSVFGMFSAFLFVRTGHLVSPVLAHSLCNVLGLPPIDALSSHPHPRIIFTLYVLGLVIFILLLFPMTSPTWFS